jgi:hypothetical protein
MGPGNRQMPTPNLLDCATLPAQSRADLCVHLFLSLGPGPLREATMRRLPRKRAYREARRVRTNELYAGQAERRVGAI